MTVVVPVLARPHRVEPTLEAFDGHRVLFVANEGDRAERRALEAAHADHLVVPDRQTSYPCKVNAAYRSTESEWLFLAADDVTPHRGWLEEAMRVAQDTGALVVGTNDLGNQRTIDGTHSTHTFVARSYCDDPGATADRAGEVLHEGYSHWYCDDELVAVAKARGVWAHATASVVEHHHPYHGKAERDPTYSRGELRKGRDLRTFRRRQGQWQ